MDSYDPLESVGQLREWADKVVSSLKEVPLSESKARYRDVVKLVDQHQKLGIPVSDDIQLEKEILEEQLSISKDHERLVSLAKELLSLSRDINYQLKGMRRPRTTRGTKSPPKLLRVTFSDGTVISERRATDTFIRTLQYIGLERVAELRSIRLQGHPIVSDQRNESGRTIYEVDGFYVETHSSTRAKASLIERIEQELGIGLTIEVIDT